MSTKEAPAARPVDPVEASPLLRLPKETRKEMLENGEANPFINAAIDQYVKKNCPQILSSGAVDSHKAKADREKLHLYFYAVRKAFVAYDASGDEGGGFAAYAGTILARDYRQAQEAECHVQTSAAPFDRKKSAKLRKIFEYADERGRLEDLYSDSTLREEIADVFGITPKQLDALLKGRSTLVSSDAPINNEGSEATLQSTLLSNENIEENTEIALTREFNRILTMMETLDNRKKEEHRDRYALCWSECLLEYLRGNEKYLGKGGTANAEVTEAEKCEQRNDRLVRCDELAPLAAHGCLWDVMLCMDYVAYLIAAPLPNRKLPPIATNPLKDPATPPSNKALAAYCGVSASAISQQMYRFQNMLHALLKQAALLE